MHAVSIFTVGTGVQLLWLETFNIVASLLHSYFCVACLYFLPFLDTFCTSIADVPAWLFTKDFKGFHISLCFHFLPLLMYLTLCILDCGTMPGPDMSLGVCHLCCHLLIYTHRSICTLLHFCSPRFWFIDHTCLCKTCCFKRWLCLTLFPASKSFIWSTISSHKYLSVIWKKRGSFEKDPDWEPQKATNLGYGFHS